MTIKRLFTVVLAIFSFVSVSSAGAPTGCFPKATGEVVCIGQDGSSVTLSPNDGGLVAFTAPAPNKQAYLFRVGRGDGTATITLKNETATKYYHHSKDGVFESKIYQAALLADGDTMFEVTTKSPNNVGPIEFMFHGENSADAFTLHPVDSNTTLAVNESGDLIVDNALKFTAPKCHNIADKNAAYPCSVIINSGNEVSYAVAATRSDLVTVDPGAIWYTGAQINPAPNFPSINLIAHSEFDNTIISAGIVEYTSIITTPGAFNFVNTGSSNIFFKTTADGSQTLWIATIGGEQSDAPGGLVVLPNGDFILGAHSTDPTWPTTAGSYQPAKSAPTPVNYNREIVLNRFNSSASIMIAGTYFGGGNGTGALSASPPSTELLRDIKLDRNGDLVVLGTTRSAFTPTTPNAFDLTHNNTASEDILLAKFTTDLSTLLYSTYFGGISGDTATDLAITYDNKWLITGTTRSNNFPVSTGAYDTTYGGGGTNTNTDMFVTKFDPTNNALISTYFGFEPTEGGTSIGTDISGNIYVGANVTSVNILPVTPNAIKSSPGANGGDHYHIKFNSALNTILYATYVGGSSGDTLIATDVDSSGNVTAVGFTTSANFQVTPGAYQLTQSLPFDEMGTITTLNQFGTLVYSSLFNDPSGPAYFNALYAVSRQDNGDLLVGGHGGYALQSTPGASTSLAILLTMKFRDLPTGVERYCQATPLCNAIQGDTYLSVTSLPIQNNPIFGVTINNAPPNTSGFLVLSLVPDLAGTQYGPLTVCLDISNPANFILVPIFTDANGYALFNFPLPAGVPAGITAYWQALLYGTAGCGGVGTVGLSNALMTTTQ